MNKALSSDAAIGPPPMSTVFYVENHLHFKPCVFVTLTLTPP